MYIHWGLVISIWPKILITSTAELVISTQTFLKITYNEYRHVHMLRPFLACTRYKYKNTYKESNTYNELYLKRIADRGSR